MVKMVDVNLTELPLMLAEKLGISDFAGKILCSAIFMMMFVMPVAIWRRGFLSALFMAIITMSFLVAITWLPSWTMIITILLIGALYASKVKEGIS